MNTEQQWVNPDNGISKNLRASGGARGGRRFGEASGGQDLIKLVWPPAFRLDPPKNGGGPSRKMGGPKKNSSGRYAPILSIF